LTYGEGRAGKHNVWTLAQPAASGASSLAEDEANLRRLLDEAVTAALPSDGRVLCELSGGLDSSTIFTLARRTTGTRVEALSYIYSHSHTADERRWIAIV